MSLPRKIRIGIDFALGSSKPYEHSGCRRYGCDLIQSLAKSAPSQFEFTVFGEGREPLQPLSAVFAKRNWNYVPVRVFSGRGSSVVMQFINWFNAKRYRIDVWHTLLGASPVLCGRRTVTTVHDLMYEIFEEYQFITQTRVYRLERWFLQNWVGKILSISHHTAKDLQRLWKIPTKRISVVPHGTAFSRTDRSQLPKDIECFFDEDAITVLSPYNLEERKNLNALLTAFSQVKQNYPNIKLILFGKAAVTEEREQDFDARLCSLHIENKVIRLGRVSDSVLGALYARCSLFVFPSLYEGYGLPLLEAMAHGAAVIARDASSMSEIVQDSGLLVPNCTAQELAEAMARLIEDPKLRQSLGQRAKQHAKTLSLERMASSTLAVYQETFEENQKKAA